MRTSKAIFFLFLYCPQKKRKKGTRSNKNCNESMAWRGEKCEYKNMIRFLVVKSKEMSIFTFCPKTFHEGEI